MATNTKRGRRSDKEIFIAVLNSKSTKGDSIGNGALLDELGWKQIRYDRVKEELLKEGSILKGSGRGGTVRLSSPPLSVGKRVFVSYCHTDELLKNELVKHLEPLRRDGLVDIWQDGKLVPGDNWGPAITSNLDAADVVLLLVSVDFINSDFCYEQELQHALRLHEESRAVVVPIILRDCQWKQLRFGKFQALPKNAKAVTAWPNLDEAFTNVADGLRLMLKKRAEVF